MIRRSWALVAGLTAAACLGACGSGEELAEVYDVPHNDYAAGGGGASTASAVAGTLEFVGQCPTADIGEHSVGLLLPSNFTAGALADGDVVVLDQEGNVWARDGYSFEGGGAESPEGNSVLERWNNSRGDVEVAAIYGISS